MKTLDPGVARVLKRLHYPLEVMLTCVRWYVAYPLSLRHVGEMMAERGVFVDHAIIYRCALKIVPTLVEVFRSRTRPVGKSWRIDETYIKVRGQWTYLYRAVDRRGWTVDFLLSERRNDIVEQDHRRIKQRIRPMLGFKRFETATDNYQWYQACRENSETAVQHWKLAGQTCNCS